MHWSRTLALASAVALLVACEDSLVPREPPPGHTVLRDGVAHAPGLGNPVGTCTICHGADLTGGSNGEPSCFSCHGKKWP
jgi:cytochrome c5